MPRSSAAILVPGLSTSRASALPIHESSAVVPMLSISASSTFTLLVPGSFVTMVVPCLSSTSALLIPIPESSGAIPISGLFVSVSALHVPMPDLSTSSFTSAVLVPSFSPSSLSAMP